MSSWAKNCISNVFAKNCFLDLSSYLKVINIYLIINEYNCICLKYFNIGIKYKCTPKCIVITIDLIHNKIGNFTQDIYNITVRPNDLGRPFKTISVL